MKRTFVILILVLFLFLCALTLFFDFEKRVFRLDGFILSRVRMPRLILGVLAGMGLSMVGALYQGLFRNPLAEPYLLGISSGSAFGAVIGFYLGLEKIPVLGPTLIISGSFITGVLAMLGIMALSRYGKNQNLLFLLLSGVVVNTFLFALEFIIITFSLQRMQNVLLWLFGSLPVVGYAMLLPLAVIVLAGSLFLMLHFKSVNLMSISREFFLSKGLDVKKTTGSLFLVSTLMVAAITSLCGIIGFVGLIVPHLARFITGHDYRRIFPFTLLAGPFFLVLSDLLNKGLFYPREVPLGMLTTLIGAPLFFFLLRRSLRTDV